MEEYGKQDRLDGAWRRREKFWGHCESGVKVKGGEGRFGISDTKNRTLERHHRWVLGVLK